MIVEIPMAIPSRANARGHWRRRHQLSKQQRATTTLALLKFEHRPQLPATVRLVRVAPRVLDDDNLRGALKSVRDAVADWLGLPNDRDPRVLWLYGQARDEKARARYVAARIEIEPAA